MNEPLYDITVTFQEPKKPTMHPQGTFSTEIGEAYIYKNNKYDFLYMENVSESLASDSSRILKIDCWSLQYLKQYSDSKAFTSPSIKDPNIIDSMLNCISWRKKDNIASIKTIHTSIFTALQTVSQINDGIVLKDLEIKEIIFNTLINDKTKN